MSEKDHISILNHIPILKSGDFLGKNKIYECKHVTNTIIWGSSNPDIDHLKRQVLKRLLQCSLLTDNKANSIKINHYAMLVEPYLDQICCIRYNIFSLENNLYVSVSGDAYYVYPKI